MFECFFLPVDSFALGAMAPALVPGALVLALFEQNKWRLAQLEGPCNQGAGWMVTELQDTDGPDSEILSMPDMVRTTEIKVLRRRQNERAR